MDRNSPKTAESFSRISQLLLESREEPQTLQQVVDLAVATVDGCDWAGVSLRRGSKVETPASTDPVVDRADSLQYEFAEGPCLDAVWVGDTQVVKDLATEHRWSTWAPAASELGIRSVLSVRLSTGEMTVGKLNLYSGAMDAFDDDDVHVAHVYAIHAAIALAVTHEISTLHTALQSRHVIGVAQGILMQRYQLSLDQAFQVLRRTSQNQNVKLRELAEQVVAERRLPPGSSEQGGARR